jgi:alpha-1,3-mannosyltransferase
VRRIGFWGRRQFFIPRVSLRFLREFDIIHVHNTDGFFDTLAVLSPLIRRPMVATTHGGFFHTGGTWFRRFKTVYFHTITRITCRAYGTLFATSENDAATFRRIARHVVVQPNAVEPLGDMTARGKDFIYIGRLAAHKHVERLITTFAHHATHHKGQGNLHIVGPEWDVTRADLTALAKKLKVGGRVHLHGFIKPDELQKLLASCGFFVSASTFEGFGMSLIEGMSVGLIPLVQPNASFKTLLEQSQIGFCVNYENGKESGKLWAEKTGTVAPATRTSARAFATRFAWKPLVEICLETYTAALTRKPRA